jgi:hypothetical protein
VKGFWVDQHRDNLLNMTIDELASNYPDKKIENLIRRQQEYKAMEKNGQEKPTSRVLKKEWEVSAYDREAGEWTTTMNHGYEHLDDPNDISEAYKPVEAAKITPTRRKAIKRLGKRVLIYGDGQVGYRRRIDPVTDETELIPTHNIPMHNIIQQINAEYMPETTVNLGDFADFPELSRFDPDSDHFHKTLGMSMRYIHDFYAQLVADNPKGHHVEVDSNHAIRPRKQILSKIPALYDFVRPGEEDATAMLTYYYLANLGKLNIDFKSGYGGAEYEYGGEYGAAPIIFKHGNHSSSAPGTTVRKESSQNPEVHVIRGHGHNDEEIRVTRRDGSILIYKQFGSSCLNDGPTPGYANSIDDQNRPVKYHNQNHQNTFGMLDDHEDGTYSLHTIDVVNGKARFEEKEYDGNE